MAKRKKKLPIKKLANKAKRTYKSHTARQRKGKMRHTPKKGKSTYKQVKKQVKKVVSTAKKLNQRKLINKAVKKVLKKKTAKLKKTTIKALYRGLLGQPIEEMNRAQLQKYIKKGVKLVNESIPSMNRASKKAVLEALKIFGEGKTKGTLSDITSRDRKLLLVEKARLLESIIEGDHVSTVALIIKNMKTAKAYQSFKKGAVGKNMEGITFDEYNEMVKQAGRIQGILKTNGNSETFQEFEMLWEYGDRLDFETIGDIVERVRNKHVGEGLDEEALHDLILKELEDAVS